MEIRFIKEEDIEQVIFILSQSYYTDCENEYQLAEKDKFRYEDYIGTFDGEKLVAVLQCEPHYMWLDGQSVKSGGIANVACLPESRRGGLVRKMIKFVCDKMYDEEYVASYLYPFSYPYYRKFGYELCNEMYRMEAPMEELMHLPFDGSAKQFEPGENGTDPGDIVDIYETFAKKYNIMLDRDAWQWEKHLEHDPVQSKTRTYVIYDANDKACAYFTSIYNNNQNPVEISIKDLAWTDYDAMYLLFAFIARYRGNAVTVKFLIPPEMMVSRLWTEPNKYKASYEASGMARIINAEKALENIEKPDKEGCFTIKINDSFMEQNDKSYKVSWKKGKTEVKEYESECDIECSIMALAQLVTGFAGLKKAVMRDDIQINANHELLYRTFTQKNIFMADFF